MHSGHLDAFCHRLKVAPLITFYIALFMDEVHIKKDLVFDKHSEELIGFTNLGDVNHIGSLEKASGELSHILQPLTKSMLVLMVRELLSGFKFPYAQLPYSILTGDQLYIIF